MKHAFAPLALIVAALLTSCNDEVADNAAQADATPAADELPCESARLLRVRAVERAEARVGGPVPPIEEGETRPAGVASSTIYYLSLDCGGKAYIARVLSGTPGFQPDELEAAGTLRLRAEGGKIFLKGEAGTEFEATLAAAPSTESRAPGQ